MATLDVTRSYEDGQVLTEADLDAFLDDIEAFLNVTKITDDNVANNSITGSLKLLTGSVTAAKLATDSVTTIKIQDNAVTEPKILDGAVTTSKIDDEAVTTAKLAPSAITAVASPTGSITAFGADTAPDGWLLCDGTAVSRTTYSALFAVIGESFGQGDNVSTFNVPDLRGRFLRGIDDGAGVDPDAASRTAMATGGATGDAVGSVQDSAFQSHGHNVSDSGHTHNIRTTSGGGAGTRSWNAGSSGGAPQTTAGAAISSQQGTVGTLSGDWNASATTGLTVTTPSSGNVTTETRPKNAGVYFIIKT